MANTRSQKHNQNRGNSNTRGSRALNQNELEVQEMTKSTTSIRKLTVNDIRGTVAQLANVSDKELTATIEEIERELIKAGAVIVDDGVSKITTANFNRICNETILRIHRQEILNVTREEVRFTVENANVVLTDEEKATVIENITVDLVDTNTDKNEKEYTTILDKYLAPYQKEDAVKDTPREQVRKLPVGTITPTVTEVNVVSINEKGQVEEEMNATVKMDAEAGTATIKKTHDVAGEDGVILHTKSEETVTISKQAKEDIKDITEHSEVKAKVQPTTEQEIVSGNNGSTRTTIKAMVDGKEVEASAVRIVDTTIPYTVSFTQQLVSGLPTAIAAGDSKWDLRTHEEKREIIKSILKGFREYNTTTLHHSQALIIPMKDVNINSLTSDELDIAIWGQVDPFAEDSFEHHAIRDFTVADGILYFTYAAEEVA